MKTATDCFYCVHYFSIVLKTLETKVLEQIEVSFYTRLQYNFYWFFNYSITNNLSKLTK